VWMARADPEEVYQIEQQVVVVQFKRETGSKSESPETNLKPMSNNAFFSFFLLKL
jgi:hypothetical protein